MTPEGRGLSLVLGEALRDAGFRHDWRRTAAHYRMFLYHERREEAADPGRGRSGRVGMKEAVVEAVVEKRGAMTVREALRHRVRCLPRFARPSGCLRQADSALLRLCDGAVLGTAGFVNAVFEREQAERQHVGEKRTSGARRMRARTGANCGCCGICRRM